MDNINFRDIGGLKTDDNKITQPGFVFRSSQLSSLPANELRMMLDKHGIKRIIDFRTCEEIKKHGSYPSDVLSDIEYIQYPLQCEGIAIDEALKRERELTGDQYLYYHLIKNETMVYRKVFDLISEANELPVVIHCIAGKDRTGIMIALLLLALGVNKKAVYDDFMITPRAKTENFQMLSNLIEEAGGISAYLDGIRIGSDRVSHFRSFLVR